MATATPKSGASEALKQLTYLAAALKAPRITEAAPRLADHARDAGWTHEEYLAAVLEGRSRPEAPPAPSCGSGPPGSPRSRPCRSSTSTPKARCASRSPPWPLGRS